MKVTKEQVDVMFDKPIKDLIELEKRDKK